MTVHPVDAAPSQGAAIDLRGLSVADRAHAFDAALGYRGDVTVTLEDGASFECYVFDCRTGTGGGELRVMMPATGERRTIAFATVVRIDFSGKDTAAGKTWENWVRRYVEKRLAGERASIEGDPLE